MIIVRIAMKALLEKRTEIMQTLLSMIEPAGKEKGCLNGLPFGRGGDRQGHQGQVNL